MDRFDDLLTSVIPDRVDETFIGGKARNMHPRTRAQKIKGTGPSTKTAVMGILERDGEVRAMPVPDVRKRTLQGHVREQVEAGSQVYSDSHEGLSEDFAHETIDHAVAYVEGQVHTNGMENFWSLLKRSLKGTYVSVEPFHLFRYLDEQVYRFNKRKANDFTRFAWVLGMVAGRRITYAELTGKA